MPRLGVRALQSDEFPFRVAAFLQPISVDEPKGVVIRGGEDRLQKSSFIQHQPPRAAELVIRHNPGVEDTAPVQVARAITPSPARPPANSFTDSPYCPRARTND